MSRYFAEIRVPPFTKGKREYRKVYLIGSKTDGMHHFVG